MFEIHLLSPLHHDEVQQEYNQVSEFNALDPLLQNIHNKMERVSSLSPKTSPKQLHSADCLSGEDREVSVLSNSSGALFHFDLNNLWEDCQDDYAFLQVPSPLGMDHPESFMDPDTDIIRESSSDSEVSNPSPAYTHEVIQKL